MKVGHFITSLDIGGAEKLIVDSIPYYNSNLNNNVEVVVLSDSDTDFKKKMIQNVNGKIVFLSKKSVYNPLLIFKLLSYINRYDILHVHLFPTIYWVVIAKVLSFSKVKIVYTEHSTSNRRRNIKVFKILDKWIYSKLDFIGCISTACLTNLREHLKYNKNTIKVVNNGINLHAFEDIIVSKREFFSDSDFVLIQVSSFRTQKDQKTVIKSLILLPDRIKLLLVGEGPLYKDCLNLVTELGLNERVIFTGNRSDVSLLLKQSDLAVQSSEYEGFGLAAVEAMAVGKAVIASDVEGLNEVVGNYGLLFPKGNYEILSELILKLYKDEEYKKDIEFRCKKRSEEFSIEFMIQEYIDIYKSILSKK